MLRTRFGLVRTVAVAAAAVVALAPGAASAAPGAQPQTQAQSLRFPIPLRVGQIAEQDIASQPGSEPDTLVEPDIAVSPVDPRIAVAVAHDGRFPDGGAVDISYSWTHDAGRHWQHAPMPGLTVANGGVWDRVSDPVVAFGPDGTVYISTLLISLSCPSAVGVSRSTDGGRTFGRPVLADFSDTCAFSDDKNWLVVDTSPTSRHRGRLYQFWTPFLTDEAGNDAGSPQMVRWSDDRGSHWSRRVAVSALHANTQGSQPMLRPDGTITDAYLNFGPDGGGEEPEHQVGSQARPTDRPRSAGRTPAAGPAAAPEGDTLVATTSRDGGATWSAETVITDRVGEGPPGVRCCLPSANADPRTGLMYAAWDDVEPDVVNLSRSSDGRHWSAPIEVSRSDRPGLDRVNVDVTAYGGRVFVAYGTRDTSVEAGRFVQQQVSASVDRGAHFGRPVSVGPLSDLRFAAQARGIFPGDYIGSAASRGLLYLVWCRSSAPADPAATFHQTLFGATLLG
jgi:hypothetical protein